MKEYLLNITRHIQEAGGQTIGTNLNVVGGREEEFNYLSPEDIGLSMGFDEVISTPFNSSQGISHLINICYFLPIVNNAPS